MYVKAEGELSDFYKEIIADELNVKEVVFTNDTKEFTTYQFKPQLRTLGRRFGSRLNELKEVLAGLDGNATMDALNASGEVTVTVGGVDEVLATEDLLVETAQMDGYVSEEDHGITVVLDTNLTPELIEEGFVREVISKIQTMRKDAGFEVVDHIRVYEQGNDKIKEIIKTNESQIKADVLVMRLFWIKQKVTPQIGKLTVRLLHWVLQKWKRNEEFVTEREVIYGICNGKGKEKGIEE